MKIKFLLLSLGFSLIGLAARAQYPPGTVKIVDRFYADQTERTNQDWREYQFWLAKNHGLDSEQYAKAKLDTTVWEHDAFAQHYHQHPAYDSYPVVGVSHQQAQDYCRWRTKVVREMLEANFPINKRYHLRNLEYRLPTVTEWQLIARLNRDRQLRPKWKIKHDGKRLFNLRTGARGYSIKRSPPSPGALIDNASPVAPVFSYIPGALEIYNLFGNVAEMVQEPNIAMGGGYIHTERAALNQASFNYDKPEKWLGFRCVCSITTPKVGEF